jgi:hypothetical protein
VFKDFKPMTRGDWVLGLFASVVILGVVGLCIAKGYERCDDTGIVGGVGIAMVAVWWGLFAEVANFVLAPLDGGRS